ncbi:hypothetical protein KQI52_10275 [bacterium]|nr:hypothetical protein [bacterium]
MFFVTSTFAGDPWADEVVSVSYGTGAGFGQDDFPDNILGPPDPNATPAAPANTEAELLTLGSGGEIVLAFLDGGIVNGSGPDFTVFENAFLVGGGPAVFTETAFVAVSEDGVTWYEFPWTTDPVAGVAGLTPTDGSADPTDPSVSGGDSFDLADIGLEHALYLRLTDTDDLVPDNGTSFDLDAVAVIHGEMETHAPAPTAYLPERIEPQAWPNPFNANVSLLLPVSTTELIVVDMLGRTVDRLTVNRGRAVWDASGFPSGQYLLQPLGPHETTPLRVVKVR